MLRLWHRRADRAQSAYPGLGHAAPHVEFAPGLVVSNGQGPALRLDRRLEGIGGRRYWIVSVIDRDGDPPGVRRVISEDRLGRLARQA